jgi:predicted AAA+ superfamily ATPase
MKANAVFCYVKRTFVIITFNHSFFIKSHLKLFYNRVLILSSIFFPLTFLAFLRIILISNIEKLGECVYDLYKRYGL